MLRLVGRTGLRWLIWALLTPPLLSNECPALVQRALPFASRFGRALPLRLSLRPNSALVGKAFGAAT